MLGVGTLKITLVRSSMEMMTMFLETGGKVILIISSQRTKLNCVPVFCGS